jgi:hypothetical protein
MFLKNVDWQRHVTNKAFKVDIIKAHPRSYDYQSFWKEQLKKVREGVWEQGKWMPGRLYYFTNFHNIYRNKGKNITQKVYALPDLRDIEWEIFLLIEEMRGFSGFDGDEEYTCLEEYEYMDIHKSNIDIESEAFLHDRSVLKKDKPEIWSEILGQWKEYIPARHYLKQIHSHNKGIPMYRNQAKNMLWLTGRGGGKSIILAAQALYEWLFDGKPPVNKYLDSEDRVSLKDMKASIIMGAGDKGKTSTMVRYMRDAYSRLPGIYESPDRAYPAPFSKQYTGGFDTKIVSSYKKKEKGKWYKDAGSGSIIRNLSFLDNPFAGQGDRNGLILLEEIGMFNNLIKVYNALTPNTKYDTTKKFGSIFMTGTGGDIAGGGTVDAQYMFYNPKNFDLLTFDDQWEHRGMIAYFMSSYMLLNQHRDEEGIVDLPKAKITLDNDLEKMRLTKDRDAYEMEMIYKARVPSEVFLTPNGNIFPIVELKERLTQLEIDGELDMLEKKVSLHYSPNGINGVTYKLLDKGEALPINKFPWSDGASKEGCVVLYELPIEEKRVIDETNYRNQDYSSMMYVPEGLYVIGHDPFRTNSENGSLAATVVMKTKKYGHKYGHDEIVAVYYGRPFEGRDASNEILFKLALMYNAKVMFENNVGNVKDFFEKKKRLDLLYKRPSSVLSNKDALHSVSMSIDYGYPLSNQKLKMEALQYLRTWLLEERGRENVKKQIVTYDKFGKKKILEIIESQSVKEEDAIRMKNGEDLSSERYKQIRNLDKIHDRRLLEELISYNLDGNFDAVHGCIGAVLALEEDYNKKTSEVFQQENANKMKYFTENRRIFKDLDYIEKRRIVAYNQNKVGSPT